MTETLREIKSRISINDYSNGSTCENQSSEVSHYVYEYPFSADKEDNLTRTNVSINLAICNHLLDCVYLHGDPFPIKLAHAEWNSQFKMIEKYYNYLLNRMDAGDAINGFVQDSEMMLRQYDEKLVGYNKMDFQRHFLTEDWKMVKASYMTAYLVDESDRNEPMKIKVNLKDLWMQLPQATNMQIERVRIFESEQFDLIVGLKRINPRNIRNVKNITNEWTTAILRFENDALALEVNPKDRNILRILNMWSWWNLRNVLKFVTMARNPMWAYVAKRILMFDDEEYDIVAVIKKDIRNSEIFVIKNDEFNIIVVPKKDYIWNIENMKQLWDMKDMWKQEKMEKLQIRADENNKLTIAIISDNENRTIWTFILNCLMFVIKSCFCEIHNYFLLFIVVLALLSLFTLGFSISGKIHALFHQNSK